jgi:hypothetical protein
VRLRVAILASLGACAFAPAVAGATTVLPGFHSPSGNIRCLFVPGPPASLLCNLRQADYAKTLEAHCLARATVDWHGFQLPGTGNGTILCSGGILYNPDTQRPRYVDLPYGQTWRHATFACVSRRTGVTCRNRGGHTLFVSRQSWRFG